MKSADSLKELERSAYRSTLKDGVYDIAFGLVFLTLAWIPILETIGLSRFVGYSLLFISVIAFPFLAKRYITIPRMGAVEFGEKRKSRTRLVLAIGVGAILLMLPVIVMIVNRNVSEQIGWPMIAMFVAPVIVIALLLLDSPRLVIYGAFLLAAVAESEFLLDYVSSPFNGLIAFGIPGAIFTVIGMTLLIKFMQKHPKATPEIPYVTR